MTRIAAAFAILTLTSTAHADPFVFEFEMPALGPSFALRGQVTTIQLTVDNGGDIALGQSYSFAQIIGARLVETEGGRVDYGLFTERREQGDQDIVILTTDDTGSATLSLISDTASWVALSHRESGYILQLATSAASQTIGAHGYSIVLEALQGGLLRINAPGIKVEGAWVE